MSETTHLDVLQSLYDTLRGVCERHADMMTRESEPLVAHVGPIADIHCRHMQQLRDAMLRLGGTPPEAGAGMGKVRPIALILRDAGVGLNVSALDAVARSERDLLDDYDRTIGILGPDHRLTRLVRDQRSALAAAVTRLAAAA